MNTREKGNIGEDKAVEFLIKNNYQIVTRNFYSRFGEIDIIAKKGEVLHFIEVKSGDNFQPIYNVTYSKLQKIIKTALTSSEKTILVAIYNNQNQRRYIGVKLN